jgi:hypothetical protein
MAHDQERDLVNGQSPDDFGNTSDFAGLPPLHLQD